MDSWTQIPDVPTRNDYRIRVISLWNPEVYDDSDQTLTILGTEGQTSADTIWILYP